MSRQDKATTERNAKILREMLKLPENKVCADCKRNDPRWASWNIGAYLCIRCSGIHRSMGTHISKVKSVDLDTWTPEQLQNMQKWGNKHVNLYWEAHLKSGHIPPEHKMESFIRSKYESRRWAPDEPPPSDPRVLESQYIQTATTMETNASAPPSVKPTSRSSTDPVSYQPRAHQLLSSPLTKKTAAAQPVTTASLASSSEAAKPVQAPQSVQNDLFSLDFHSPPPSEVPQQQPVKKDAKQDILSLFSNTPAPNLSLNNHITQQMGVQPQAQTFGWGQPALSQFSVPPSIGMPSSAMQGSWAVSNASALSGQTQGMPQSTANPRRLTVDQSLFSTQNVWDNSSNSNTSDLFSQPFSSTTPTQKKDDAFSDLWGTFK